MTDKRRGVGLLAIGQILVWAGLYYVFPAMLLQWEEELGWARTELTAAFTLAVLLSALFSPFAGRIIDQGHGAIMMFLSAVIGGIFLVAVSRVSQTFEFYFCWAFIGIAFSGCLYEPCFAIITRASGESAKKQILKVTLIAGFASTISFPGIHFLGVNMGWRNALMVFGLIVSLVAAPILYLGSSRLEKSTPQASAAPDKMLRSLNFLNNPVFWLTGIAFAWIALIHGMTLHHLLPLLRENGISATTAVFAASFIGPMQVIGRLIMVSTDRLVSTHSLTVACFAALGLSIMFLAGSGTQKILLVLFVVSFGSAYGMVSVLRPVIARDLLGEADYGAKSGILASLYLTMSALAPYLGALLWHRGGYELVLTLSCLLSFVGLFFYFIARKLSETDR